MPLIAGKEGNSIFCRPDYGPIFGWGHDLVIVSEGNSNDCWSGLNNSYQCPAGQNGTTFLTGNKCFTVSEMEVFAIKVEAHVLTEEWIADKDFSSEVLIVDKLFVKTHSC